MLPELLLVVAGAALTGLGYHYTVRLRDQHLTWRLGLQAALEERGLRAVGQDHGLTWTDGGLWVLEEPKPADGGLVELDLRAPANAQLAMRLRRASGLSLVDSVLLDDVRTADRTFDQQWAVESDDHLAARLALGQKAREALERIAPTTLLLDFTALRVTWTEAAVPPVPDMLNRLDAVAEFAAALHDGAWTEVGRRLGLASPNHRELHGTLDGVVVAARAGNGTRVRAFRQTPLRAIHRDRPLDGAFPSQNPVLDQLVRVGGDPSLRERLQDPDLLEPLLEVVHGWPGSFVDREGVTLVSDDVLINRLEEALRAVVRLARVLP